MSSRVELVKVEALYLLAVVGREALIDNRMLDTGRHDLRAD